MENASNKIWTSPGGKLDKKRRPRPRSPRRTRPQQQLEKAAQQAKNAANQIRQQQAAERNGGESRATGAGSAGLAGRDGAIGQRAKKKGSSEQLMIVRELGQVQERQKANGRKSAGPCGQHPVARLQAGA